jgi:hypothetical protein
MLTWQISHSAFFHSAVWFYLKCLLREKVVDRLQNAVLFNRSLVTRYFKMEIFADLTNSRYLIGEKCLIFSCWKLDNEKTLFQIEECDLVLNNSGNEIVSQEMRKPRLAQKSLNFVISTFFRRCSKKYWVVVRWCLFVFCTRIWISLKMFPCSR